MGMTVAKAEMHDRINRVIQSRVPALDGVNLCDLVDAILLAMREPTETMLSAWSISPKFDNWRTQAIGDWQAMIDAALALPNPAQAVGGKG